MSIFAAFGISRITVDDSLTELFRADTPDFKQYERLSSRFPSSEYDVLVVVEGPTLLERNRWRPCATPSSRCSSSPECRG